MMPDYMEFPDINAPTPEGKIKQITDWAIKLQEKYNHLVEDVEKLKEK